MAKNPKFDSGVWLKNLKLWGPAALWMFVIYWASADSNSFLHSSQLIEPVCRWLAPRITPDQLATVQFLARKGAHMTEFACLAILLVRALSQGRGDARKWASTAWVLATAYAATDEFHQWFVPNRNASLVDVSIDSAGAALGLLVYVFLLGCGAKSPPAEEAPPKDEGRPAARRGSFADRLLCTLEGEDIEFHTPVRLEVQDRLQRENGGCIILGRNEKIAQLHLRNTSVSAQHLRLIFRGGQFEVEDLDSSNGTLLNGKKLVPFQPEALADGSRIEVGEIMLHFRQFA